MVDVLLGRKNETLYPNTVIRVLKSLADLDESISEALISDFTAYVKLVE